MLRGAYDILDTVCSHLGGVKPGETTKDGKFTVIEVECQGACSNAPMFVVGDDFYVRLPSFGSAFPSCDGTVGAGGPHGGDDAHGAGCVQEGREAQARAAERTSYE